MTNIIIIHGTGGNPEGNWFPWLKYKLEKLGCNVFVPRFPTPHNQSLENWLKVFKDYEQYLDESTIVVGHSLGPAFLLTVIENSPRQLKAAFFVAGFLKKLNRPEFIESNKTFVERPFDWAKIKSNCKEFYVINSDNDPYVPLEKGEELAERLGTKLIVLKDAGHINKESGYTQFEFLYEMIKRIL